MFPTILVCRLQIVELFVEATNIRLQLPPILLKPSFHIIYWTVDEPVASESAC